MARFLNQTPRFDWYVVHTPATREGPAGALWDLVPSALNGHPQLREGLKTNGADWAPAGSPVVAGVPLRIKEQTLQRHMLKRLDYVLKH